ncbi:alginate lyase family protein [Sunxiuqinia indica]|uniref:alginate lyase family protein n=1 Tax=Sunxiuqinia indica TaxID=2692584 RepID=UPI00135868E3|nr:alginate lyase family protein [Sunxiuqinia indica]
MKRINLNLPIIVLMSLLICCMFITNAQTTFIHPGGLHTQADLDRMKSKVAEKEHPWIDGWRLLNGDPLAQNTYKASPQANMNLRQLMSKDAHAAYLNAIRWYVSGDESYAKCAINIFNDYSSVVNQIPSGGNTDIVGLGGIGISELAMAAEIMRIYDGWSGEDFERFKNMMVEYFYPVCHDFLINHNGACIDYYWANWDANNITALIAIGVLCDNQAIYDEGVEYFKNGKGTGSIKHAVYHIHEENLGQWQESGRDQEHAQLGVGLLGTACQIAWNQGLDLFGYDNNRLLAGAEYTAKYNQMQEVPFQFYNNCQPSNHKWPAINGRGRLDDRPVWEMLYNHYVVRQGLSAPNVQRMAELMRPEHGSKDHFGYGTLTFTLEDSKFPPFPVPGMPTELKATAGIGKVFLTWQAPEDYTATGYVIERALGKNGEFQTIALWEDNTYTVYTDKDISNGTIYYYKVAALNQSGTGDFSTVATATPMAPKVLPDNWEIANIGENITGTGHYANVAGSTFIVSGNGDQIGGNKDKATFCYTPVVGGFEITCRISDISGSLSKTGLMIRESLNANSPVVTMTLGEGGGRFARMGYRKSTNAEMSSTLGNTYTWRPAWFRLKRNGDTFTVFESSDGEKWFEVDSVEITMTSQCFAGMAVSSRNSNSKNTTTFDHVTVNMDEN